MEKRGLELPWDLPELFAYVARFPYVATSRFPGPLGNPPPSSFFLSVLGVETPISSLRTQKWAVKTINVII